MKKLLLKGLLLAFIAVALSSCLGSSNGTIENQNDFAYITRATEGSYSELYAITGTGYLVTSPNIRGLNNGDCYFISYKLSTKNMASGSIYEADNVTISDLLEKSRVIFGTAVDQSIKDSEEPVSGLTIGMRTESDILGDNWLVNYGASLPKGISYKIHFYYDEENQVDEPAKEGEAGEVIEPTKAKKIIDIRFEKDGSAGIGEKPRAVSEQLVANFADVRGRFQPMGSDNDAYQDMYGNKYTAIKFRFWKEAKDKDGNPTKKQVYIGSWGNSGNKPTYSLAYSKES